MNCNNCGKELPNGEQKCSFCGAYQVMQNDAQNAELQNCQPTPGGQPNYNGQPTPGGQPNYNGQPTPGGQPNYNGQPTPGDQLNYGGQLNNYGQQMPLRSVSLGFIEGIKALGEKNKRLFLINAGMLFLCFIFMFLPHGYVSASLVNQSKSVAVFESSGTANGMFSFIFIVALILLFIPFFSHRYYNTLVFIGENIISILMFIIFTVFAMSCFEAGSKSVFSELISTGLTFWGWLYWILLLSTIVFSFLVPHKIRKEKRARMGYIPPKGYLDRNGVWINKQ